MAVYAISDLHLSLSCEKPMDVFKGWDNYVDRIAGNWKRLVKENDTVVLPGDFSWALKLEDTLADFKFLENLPGKKLILKGNHDLWWSTRRKVENFFLQNSISSVKLVYNSSETVENINICGTRGWFYDDRANEKILKREAARLEASIESAPKNDCENVVFLHYPPVYGDEVCRDIFDVIKKYKIKRVFYGHIHGAFNKTVSEYEGVRLKLVSCDNLEFTPFLIVN